MEGIIILVGNGSSLLDAPRGEEIDRFGTVVRFNGFSLTGYERHTGVRTDVWIRHPWFRGSRPSREKLVRVARGRPLGWAYLLIFRSKRLPDDGQDFLESRYRRQDAAFTYTTGMAALAHYALHHPVVHIAGFRDSVNAPKGVHYYDTLPPCTRHDYALERRIIDDLKREGRCIEW